MTTVRWSLILMTLVSVTADTLLLPFYPQFFRESFGVTDPAHTGWYIAACCTTVMLSFPVWARIARHWHELPLWVVTQSLSAVLGLLCFYTESLLMFWLLSQLMLMMKASYLLIYPFAIRLEHGGKVSGMVALFALLMHVGTIGGALLGGYLLQFWDGRDAYLVMIASDLVQILVCLGLMALLKVRLTEPGYVPEKVTGLPRHPMVYRLALVALLFYFSVFLIRPFFTLYWQGISPPQWAAEIPTSLVYAIPGLVALLTLFWQHLKPSARSSQSYMIRGLVACFAGLVLQAVPEPLWTVTGRLLFGWGLFLAVVHIEVILFAHSRPERFAEDFSRVHLGQNIGVILASFAAGALVTSAGYLPLFVVAASGILVVSLVAWRGGVLTDPDTPSTHSSSEALT